MLRDITAQANNEQVKRGRGRPRKAIETMEVPMDVQQTNEHAGEKSSELLQKISEAQFISNFQSISSVMNNVDDVDH